MSYLPGVTFRQVLVACGKSNHPPLENNVYLVQLANSQPQQFQASKKKKKSKVGEAGAGPPVLTPPQSQVSALIVLVRRCCSMRSSRQLRALLLLLLSKSFQIRVSSFLIPQLLLRPCGYSTDQRGFSGLKTGFFMLKVSEGLSRK